MRIILAPDSFKGTFTSAEVIEFLRAGCRQHFPEAEIIPFTMADGGEGTVAALSDVVGCSRVTQWVTGPLGKPVSADMALQGDLAVIEMAQASGLGLLSPEERNPLETSTRGTGELILKALDAGARRLLIGIGGSATNDGGMGMAAALGICFKDQSGNLLRSSGKDLEKIHTLDVSGLDPRIKGCEIVAMCDVSNPLTGEIGATKVYGPQKGADPEMVEQLEKGMQNYRDHLKKLTGIDPDTLPGAGAAGGLGAAIALLLGGRLTSGVDAILDTFSFEEAAKNADFIITGEGRLDSQSLYGKVPVGIARRCKGKGLKVFVLAGSIGGEISSFYREGIHGVYPVVSEPCALDEVLSNPEKRMEWAVDNFLRLIRGAMDIRR